jgi:hypothetical protein
MINALLVDDNGEQVEERRRVAGNPLEPQCLIDGRGVP